MAKEKLALFLLTSLANRCIIAVWNRDYTSLCAVTYGMAQAAHARAEFDAYQSAQTNINNNDDFWQAISSWREDREFGVTLVLHETLETFGKISMNVEHWGYVTDPTYPYRNYYGEVFTRSEVTCMWTFVYSDEELEYMRQFGLHK